MAALRCSLVPEALRSPLCSTCVQRSVQGIRDAFGVVADAVQTHETKHPVSLIPVACLWAGYFKGILCEHRPKRLQQRFVYVLRQAQALLNLKLCARTPGCACRSQELGPDGCVHWTMDQS